MHADYTVRERVTRRKEWVITNPPVSIADMNKVLSIALASLLPDARQYDDALMIEAHGEGDETVIVIYANETTTTTAMT